ncbi:hypothetical protein WMY93_031466, partial [Mugilogobius chulae]
PDTSQESPLPWSLAGDGKGYEACLSKPSGKDGEKILSMMRSGSSEDETASGGVKLKL